MVPASVDVNNPFKIPPITMKKMMATAMNSGSVSALSPQVKVIVAFGPRAGLILHHTHIMIMKKKEMSNAGNIPARNSFPIDCSVMIPNMIIVILGGKRIPMVPTLATIPVDNFLRY